MARDFSCLELQRKWTMVDLMDTPELNELRSCELTSTLVVQTTNYHEYETSIESPLWVQYHFSSIKLTFL